MQVYTQITNTRISVSTSSTSATSLGTLASEATVVKLSNEGSQPTWVKLGDSSVADATTSDICILSGETLAVGKSPTHTHFKAISIGSGCQLNVATGYLN